MKNPFSVLSAAFGSFHAWQVWPFILQNSSAFSHVHFSWVGGCLMLLSECVTTQTLWKSWVWGILQLFPNLFCWFVQTLSPNGVLAPLLEMQEFPFLQTEENCQGEYFYYFEYFFFQHTTFFSSSKLHLFKCPWELICIKHSGRKAGKMPFFRSMERFLWSRKFHSQEEALQRFSVPQL